MTKYNPIIEPTREDCIYAAGFADGEGHIAVQQISEPGKPIRYRAYVEIAQVDPTPLHWLAARWGGPVYTFGREKNPLNARDCSSWRIAWNRAFRFCCDIEPFVIVKVEHIKAVLAEPSEISYLRSRQLNKRGVA